MVVVGFFGRFLFILKVVGKKLPNTKEFKQLYVCQRLNLFEMAGKYKNIRARFVLIEMQSRAPYTSIRYLQIRMHRSKRLRHVCVCVCLSETKKQIQSGKKEGENENGPIFANV